MDQLAQHVEALIFVAERPLPLRDIRQCLEAQFETSFEEEELRAAAEAVMQRYRDGQYAVEVVEIADGYQFLSKGAYFDTVATYLKQTTRKQLSRSALETLSIIAYKQPVTKSEAEKIRGVSCDYAVQKLLEKELVVITGRSEAPGRPLLYATSPKFMDYFGIKSMRDLPKPKDFKSPESEIGEQAPIEEPAPGGNDAVLE